MSRVTEYLLNICLVRSFRSLFLIGIPVFLNSSLSLRYSVLHASWKAGSLYKALDILSMQSFLSGVLLPWRFQFTCNVWKNLELVWNISLGPFLVILENQNTFLTCLRCCSVGSNAISATELETLAFICWLCALLTSLILVAFLF